MRIFTAAAECAPFAKVGGLADVVYSLSRSLAAMGHEMIVTLPLYSEVLKSRDLVWLDDAEPLTLEGHFSGMYPVKRARLSGMSGVVFLFVDHPDFFNRPGFYDNPQTGEGYTDQGERFLFFSIAAGSLAIRSDHPFDVVHLHDNHTGPAAAFLKLREYTGKVIFHIHNLAYQGNYPPELYASSGLPESYMKPGGPANLKGAFSFMKCGIVMADAVVTVSPRYRDEILSTPRFGMGLGEILREKGDRFVGILNGIDTDLWNPAADPLIPHPFGPGRMAGKAKNRKVLRRAFGLIPPSRDIPVVGMVTRLAEQKGIDLLLDTIEDILKLDLHLVILGTGRLAYEKKLERMSRMFPDRLGINLTFNDRLAHLVEAGSNIFLMPSRYEPCGLNQLYSLRYGALPVVHHVGGLADTVKNLSSDGSEGWGFTFEEMIPQALLDALRRARKVYRNKALWARIVDRAMRLNFSWQTSAERFMEIYKRS